MARARWRSELGRAALIGLAACVAAGCPSGEAESAATDASEPASAHAEERPTLLDLRTDRSSARGLLQSLLEAAQRTRAEQARSALISWNTVADLLARAGGERPSPFLSHLRRGCPRLESVDAYAALEWRWLGERELPAASDGAERRRLCFTLQGYGISMTTPFPRGTPLEVALRLPVWILRRLLPPGASHPVRPRFTECVRGDARPRTWLVAVDVRWTPEGWLFEGDTIWIEGLLLVTDIT